MRTPSRIAIVLVAVAGVVFVGAGSALADTPITWEDPKPQSDLSALLLFGGSTVALIVGLTLFALLTARHNYTPPEPGTEITIPTGH